MGRFLLQNYNFTFYILHCTLYIRPVRIIGILNLTPDSGVDGGKYDSVKKAVQRVGELLREGADIIELGGESTGPQSPDVSREEERRRVLPALRAIVSAFSHAKISIDTWKASIAKETLDSGAVMINDITAGRGDAEMFEVIANARCSYVLMYSKDPTPRTTTQSRSYDDVVKHIHGFLVERMTSAESADIDRSRLIVDPGLGHFVSADPKYSFEIVSRLHEFTDLGPVLVSPSRKSFLSGPKNLPVSERLPATLAATRVAVEQGATYIRTHDVWETRKMIETCGR